MIALILMQEVGLTSPQLARVVNEHESFRWLAREGRRHVPKVLNHRPRRTVKVVSLSGDELVKVMALVVVKVPRDLIPLA